MTYDGQLMYDNDGFLEDITRRLKELDGSKVMSSRSRLDSQA
ncbi:MAG: hypothetical protein ABSC50_13830 [Candidatus Bathyarchaeia archaeon]